MSPPIKHYDIVTLFPEFFELLNFGVVGRAIATQKMQLRCWNPRDFTTDLHRTVDDKAYGGGPGMVMKAEPLCAAIQAAKSQFSTPGKVIHLSPRGRRLDQGALQHLATATHLVFVAGRYEGIDERSIEMAIDEEWSIGDYVLSGGEIPILVMLDGIARLLPGVLGDPQSATQDSFSQGLLEHPHYTRPAVLAGRSVPDVLLNGDHAAIANWRLQQSLGKTWERRPDLLAKRALSPHETQLLDEYIEQRGARSCTN